MLTYEIENLIQEGCPAKYFSNLIFLHWNFVNVVILVNTWVICNVKQGEEAVFSLKTARLKHVYQCNPCQGGVREGNKVKYYKVEMLLI